MVGDLVEAVVGDPSDGYSPLGGRDQIDVVDTDAIPDDAAKALRGDERATPDRRELDEQDIGAMQVQRVGDVGFVPAIRNRYLDAGVLRDLALEPSVVAEILVADENSHALLRRFGGWRRYRGGAGTASLTRSDGSETLAARVVSAGRPNPDRRL